MRLTIQSDKRSIVLDDIGNIDYDHLFKLITTSIETLEKIPEQNEVVKPTFDFLEASPEELLSHRQACVDRIRKKHSGLVK